MLSFVRVTMVMVSLHRNRTVTRTEVHNRQCHHIALTGLILGLLEEWELCNFGLEKWLNSVQGLGGDVDLSRNMEDSS